MEPAHLLVVAGVVAVAFFLWKNRERLHFATSSSLFAILDAIVVGYLIYLAAATIFDFSAYHTWSGAARLLFFTSKPDGAQYFSIFAGIALGYLRFFQDAGSGSHDTKREYRGGRKIWCHRSALIVANSLLAHRADKAKLTRPQHLAADQPYPQPNDESELERIVPLADVETNKALTPYVPQEGEYETALWGMIRIPYEMTTLHFLAVGATGSGKTMLIHGLMKSVLPRIKTDKNFRAFVYDDKLDFLPFAREFGFDKYVWNLDPFDAEGMAWDIAADVTTKAEAMQVASVLSPVDPNVPDAYWQQGTQDFLAAVLLNFHEVNGANWTLRDVMLAFTSEARLRKILNRDKETDRMARFYLGAHSLSDVLAVLQSKLGPYSVAAALYNHATEKKSVREWHKSNKILLVTGRSVFSQASRPINQAIFRMVSLLLLNDKDDHPGGGKKSQPRSNWIFLDEIREIGKLQGYHELANKGRSKGVRLVLGFQSIEGMMAEHGEDPANEIANLCGHRTFLHTTSVKTRNWEADQVGNTVLDETVFSFSQTVGKDAAWSNTVSWQTTRQTRQAMEASDFDQNLKLATPENGVTALNFIPYIGVYVSWVPWGWVTTHLPFPREKYLSETLRSGDDQKLGDWETPDLLRLNLSPIILDDAALEVTQKKKGEKDGRDREKKKVKPFGKTKRKDF